MVGNGYWKWRYGSMKLHIVRVAKHIQNEHQLILVILSDTEKRAHYDTYLFSQKVVVQKRSGQGSPMYTYESYDATEKPMEVVEWLKWYRYAINDIVSERRMVNGTGYFDVLENDFYSAINAAYYGPVIESMDFLPDCFEADERSVPGTPEVLHLVSGRDVFGKVCIAKKVLELSHVENQQLPSPQSLSLKVTYTHHDSVRLASIAWCTCWLLGSNEEEE